MVNKKDTAEQVERTLNSLEGLQRAAASPFILTRIQQGIANRQQYRIYGKIGRLAMVMALLAMLNGAYFLQIRNRTQPETEITAAAVAAEYDLQYNATDF